ncbi:hypothetical protein [Streptomyces sp. TRM49041]|uniref:hypothetical protein n=1 Tax=Streptomyces sp. TRM49041 TaxID=2603216 RepID=UPI0021CC9951|nr:hypothetical protein [Streptomyces sp. TRM49041]
MLDRQAVVDDYEKARRTFHALLDEARTGAAFDRVTGLQERRLAKESEEDLARGMHYPVRWDPFFKDFMTLADLYRYPVQHFDLRHDQLTLGLSG